ncbi:alpha/beta-hydrolase [Lindgomyces ingoldianus]|uniref:Alpha/beta-hydrolase n=1 Tax=Lindgomyces ingoldianus TaxID=673940 RepID=A0ACB6QER5_9PLEO|nr:alpha/beta-hydrolase [Lindgomyces ingoldianus]KAF2464645.1 alpha/beta-hydrolase [Lindgomyces ingoldianus]
MALISDLRAHLLRLYTSFTTTNTAVSTPATVKGEPSKCRYRLDNDCSDTFTLPDGRKLGYAQYGLQTGRPILYLHGIPGSRIEAAQFHDLGLKLGARIIGADRPGIGWSSPHPSRILLDFPKDLELLAKHLELDEYAVLGISGGGPYALACAVSLPREKLKCVSIVCGLGPPDIGMSGARWLNWLGFTLGYRYAPSWANRWFWQRQPIGRLDLTDEKRLELLLQSASGSIGAHEKDLEVMKDEDFLRLILRSTRESFAQGYDGIGQDGKVMCMDYGFRIEDIRADLPVQLWYAKHDVFVPLNHGKQIAARLGGRGHLRVEDETHSSIVVNWRKEILEDLVRSA